MLYKTTNQLTNYTWFLSLVKEFFLAQCGYRAEKNGHSRSFYPTKLLLYYYYTSLLDKNVRSLSIIPAIVSDF